MADLKAAASVKEDRFVSLIDGTASLEASGLIEVADLDPSRWTVASIARDPVNYTGEALGVDFAPEAPLGRLFASVTAEGLAWRWSAPNAGFDFLEDSRSVSEFYYFVAQERYRVTLVDALSGESRTEVIAIDIEGNSNEQFDVLVAGTDFDERLERVAANLEATGLLSNVRHEDVTDAIDLSVDADAVLFYTNLPFGRLWLGREFRGTMLNTDLGSVLTTFAFTDDYSLYGPTDPDPQIFDWGSGIVGFDTGPGVLPMGYRFDGLAPVDGAEADPIFRGIDLDAVVRATFANSNFPNPEIKSGATLLAADAADVPVLARNGAGNVVSANLWPRFVNGAGTTPDGAAALSSDAQEYMEFFVNMLYGANKTGLFKAPSAFSLTPVSRHEVVDGVAVDVIEAEDALYSDGVAAQSGRGASGGEFLDVLPGDAAQQVSWTFQTDVAGVYAIDFVYALSRLQDLRVLTLLLNGEQADVLPFLPGEDEGWTTWTPQRAFVELAQGRNTLTLLTGEDLGRHNGANLDYMRISEAPVGPTAYRTPSSGVEVVDGAEFVKYEAEDAVLSDAILFVKGRGASGNVFVDFPESDEFLSISWSVEVAEAGLHQIDFIHALAAGQAARPLMLTLDGDLAAILPFEASDGDWRDWAPETTFLDLSAGIHEIALTTRAGAGISNGANIDYLRISQAPVRLLEDDALMV